MLQRPLKVAIHKLTSCSGCQLAFINQGPKLLKLLEFVEFTHFIEAGLFAPDQEVDVALIEGSVSTHDDLKRLVNARQRAKLLVSIGACATSGGVQALRNMADDKENWKRAVYAHPEFIEELQDCTAVATHVKVDFELWGCPVTQQQVTECLRQLHAGVKPKDNAEKLCMECKRQGNVCVLITQQAPCLGPVVRTGCGALCPSFGKACYGCFGPSEQPNCESLTNRMTGFGLMPNDIVHRFAAIHSQSPPYQQQIARWRLQDLEGSD
ncbi:sulfhydrogenase subunit delta [Aestuariibacter salexigens]|uniref:NADH-quinone oxidoreductase subunit B family protein n=1 Tax=Aestuariibacter salexigens TaxID=226010 RepID=UPI00041A6F41|nr:sulfhydrogenase subunit delta [Aestuariibacter salexigens]